ncbi:MAG TPA: peptidoglycan editing factor PgeF [Chondromyces sp.]|nr:peptidoglycan editing factor PgeF [Chondromyces sp.]
MMEPFQLKDESFYRIPDWEGKFPDLIAGFSTKHGGISKGAFQGLNLGLHVKDNLSHVCQNRRMLSANLDVPLEKWVWAEQTHHNRIFHAGLDDRGRGSLSYEDSIADTDGLFTDEKGVMLSLCYADCVPLYFLAAKAKRIGIAHAGWKGTVKGIGAEMVRLWKEDGIDLDDIHVIIGPSICGECYLVDHKVISAAAHWIEENEEKPYRPHEEKGGQFYLDLKSLNALILKRSGISPKQIRQTQFCTSCHKQFFSHRRDKGHTGRMISFIGWKENVPS